MVIDKEEGQNKVGNELNEICLQVGLESTSRRRFRRIRGWPNLAVVLDGNMISVSPTTLGGSL